MTSAATSSTRPRLRRRLGTGLVTVLVPWLVAAPLAGSAHAEVRVVPLGTALNFSVLAGSTITNTGPTQVNRGVGLAPGTDIADNGNLVVGGATNVANPVARTAKDDLTTAYINAANQLPPIAADPELAGETLVGGVYNRADAMALNGRLVLDGQNDPDSVWVFQAGTTLITGSASSVVLIRGANPCNVFWQVGSSATFNTNTRFVGTVMARQSIAMQTGATLQGRALARNGAVTLDTNVITSPGCADNGGGDDGGGDDGGGDDGDGDDGDDGGGGDNGGGDNGGGDNGPGNPGGPDGPGTPEGPGTPGTPGSPDAPQVPQPPSGGVETGVPAPAAASPSTVTGAALAGGLGALALAAGGGLTLVRGRRRR